MATPGEPGNVDPTGSDPQADQGVVAPDQGTTASADTGTRADAQGQSGQSTAEAAPETDAPGAHRGIFASAIGGVLEKSGSLKADVDAARERIKRELAAAREAKVEEAAQRVTVKNLAEQIANQVRLQMRQRLTPDLEAARSTIEERSVPDPAARSDSPDAASEAQAAIADATRLAEANLQAEAHKAVRAALKNKEWIDDAAAQIEGVGLSEEVAIKGRLEQRISMQCGLLPDAERREAADALYQKGLAQAQKSARPRLTAYVKSANAMSAYRELRKAHPQTNEAGISGHIEAEVLQDHFSVLPPAELHDAAQNLVGIVDQADRIWVRVFAREETDGLVAELVELRKTNENDNAISQALQARLAQRIRIGAGVLATEQELGKILSNVEALAAKDAKRVVKDYITEMKGEEGDRIHRKIMATVRGNNVDSYDDIFRSVEAEVADKLQAEHGVRLSTDAQMSEVMRPLAVKVDAHRRATVEAYKKKNDIGDGLINTAKSGVRREDVAETLKIKIFEDLRGEGILVSNADVIEIIRMEFAYDREREAKVIDAFENSNTLVVEIEYERKCSLADDAIAVEVANKSVKSLQCDHGAFISDARLRKILAVAYKKADEVAAKVYKAFAKEHNLVRRINEKMDERKNPMDIFNEIMGEIGAANMNLTQAELLRRFMFALKAAHEADVRSHGLAGTTKREVKRIWGEVRDWERLVTTIEDMHSGQKSKWNPDGKKLKKDEIKAEVAKHYVVKLGMESGKFEEMFEHAFEEAKARHFSTTSTMWRNAKSYASETVDLVGEVREDGVRGVLAKRIKMRKLVAAIRELQNQGWEDDDGIVARLTPIYAEGMTEDDADAMFKEAFLRVISGRQETNADLIHKSGKKARRKAFLGKVFGESGSGKRTLWKVGTALAAGSVATWGARLGVFGAITAVKTGLKLAGGAIKTGAKTVSKMATTGYKRMTDTASAVWSKEKPAKTPVEGGFFRRNAARTLNFLKGGGHWTRRIATPVAAALALSIGVAEGATRGLGGLNAAGSDEIVTVEKDEATGRTRHKEGGLLELGDLAVDTWGATVETWQKAADFWIFKGMWKGESDEGGEEKGWLATLLPSAIASIGADDVQQIKTGFEALDMEKITAAVQDKDPNLGVLGRAKRILAEQPSSAVLNAALPLARIAGFGKGAGYAAFAYSMLKGDPKDSPEVKYEAGLGAKIGEMDEKAFQAFVGKFDLDKFEQAYGNVLMNENDFSAMVSDPRAKVQRIKFGRSLKAFFGLGKQPSHAAFMQKWRKLVVRITTLETKMAGDADIGLEAELQDLSIAVTAFQPCIDERAFNALVNQ